MPKESDEVTDAQILATYREQIENPTTPENAEPMMDKYDEGG